MNGRPTTPLPVNRMLSVAAAPGNGYVYIMNGYIDTSSQLLGWRMEGLFTPFKRGWNAELLAGNLSRYS